MYLSSLGKPLTEMFDCMCIPHIKLLCMLLIAYNVEK